MPTLWNLAAKESGAVADEVIHPPLVPYPGGYAIPSGRIPGSADDREESAVAKHRTTKKCTVASAAATSSAGPGLSLGDDMANRRARRRRPALILAGTTAAGATRHRPTSPTNCRALLCPSVQAAGADRDGAKWQR